MNETIKRREAEAEGEGGAVGPRRNPRDPLLQNLRYSTLFWDLSIVRKCSSPRLNFVQSPVSVCQVREGERPTIWVSINLFETGPLSQD